MQLTREKQAQQKINDGIQITQGEIKKHEAIDWEGNPRLNQVTKQCIQIAKAGLSFEAYLDERAKKDPKFVSLEHEENNADALNS